MENMIDTERFVLVEPWGYQNEDEAYAQIAILYKFLNGVSTYFADGRWYIVLKKALA